MPQMLPGPPPPPRRRLGCVTHRLSSSFFALVLSHPMSRQPIKTLRLGHGQEDQTLSKRARRRTHAVLRGDTVSLVQSSRATSTGTLAPSGRHPVWG